MNKLALLCALCSPLTIAGPITQIEIENNIVLFSTSSMAPSTVACVAENKNQLRSVSLDSHSGRAMYSLLITAVAKQQAVAVTSAQDCADLAGVERVQSLRLAPNTNAGNSNARSIGLYASDGITRIGTLVDTAHYKNSAYDSGQYRWTYIDDEGGVDYKTLNISYNNAEIQHEYSGCRGRQGLSTHGEPVYHHGKYIMGDKNAPFTSSADRNAQNYSCFNRQNQTSYEIIETEHPICGAGLCLVKED
ncbi:hypothetical protein [Pseudoalteromonas sp. McH1-42]|uniref:hypothetical protein n=1 Tax=Pseudoalteromonas sp. McH1-42 TaxID=2917752 RepID=UPI001EF4B2C0|nr:hypothetical protein [Pseudoalteromonas sp. McH1-42]MCG7560703.1 hypothetical protein [Pseudoalteromonas sp. McH1-42]